MSRIDVIFKEDEVLTFCDLFEFAISEGYDLNSKDIKIIENLIVKDFVRSKSNDYPLLFGFGK